MDLEKRPLKPKAKRKRTGGMKKGYKYEPGTNKRKIPVVMENYDKEGNLIGETNLLPAITLQKLSITGILKKREMGLTIPEIADAFKVSTATINRALHDYRASMEAVTDFKAARGNVLADLQRRLLSSVSDLDIQKAPLGTKIVAFCHLYDKERLENDLSTANIANLHDDIAALRKEEE